MKVSNFRLGFATNSSSTHSIIYVPNNGAANIRDSYGDEEYFGWDDFTLKSRDAKMEYIAAQLTHSFGILGIPEYVQNSYLRTEFGVEAPRSVDHQSVWNAPFKMDGGRKSLPEEWIADLKTYIADNPDVVILGGNDNSDGHPLLESLGVRSEYEDDDEDDDAEVNPSEPQAFRINLGRDDYFDRARREAPGLWTFFHSGRGTKITVDLDLNRTERPRSLTPELADIKITDYCPFGCAFCYQGSTKRGKHADMYGTWGLTSLISAMADRGVFEIAYGGGEPTMHPQFLDILKTTHHAGIKPSFTTKNLAWFNKTKEVQEALEVVGGIAFSVENVAEIEAYGRVAARYGGNKYQHPNRFTVHIVMGLQDMETFADMLRACKRQSLHVTLLGYKTTGRGSEVAPLSYDGWVNVLCDLIEKDECPSVSVDTALAGTHGDEIRNAGFPSYLFYSREGQHSVYIDAVAKKMAASSYSPETDMMPLPDQRGDYLDVLWVQIGNHNLLSPL